MLQRNMPKRFKTEPQRRAAVPKRTKAAKRKTPAERKTPSKSGKAFVFISYRRVDSAAASRWLYDAIQRTFGPESVFMDTETIRVSADWRKAIYHGL
jgi:hypothetical protein